MPRRKRVDKRRHELTLELRCVLAGMGPDEWERYWGGRAEGRAAFEALREKQIMHATEGQTYEAWLASFTEPRRTDQEPEDDVEDDEADEGDVQAPDNEETD